MLMKTTDGTPDAVKVACPVWSGGKGGDNFKALPITIIIMYFYISKYYNTRRNYYEKKELQRSL